MIYQAYQAYADMTDGARQAASLVLPVLAPVLEAAHPDWSGTPMLRQVSALLEVVARTGLTHARPAFAIERIVSGGREYAVVEEAVERSAFGTLVRFRKVGAPEQPRVLLVAPMSGHFATLLRGTVITLLADHEVCITDWHNARDIPLTAGRFDLSDYTDHIIRYLECIGPRAHLVAVCQPCVPALAAVALMAADRHVAQPSTLTLMAGPIDTRINPTEVNRLARGKPIEWFETRMIGTVPLRYPGALRRVYPGFLQLLSFMTMNLGRHVGAFGDLYLHTAEGRDAAAAPIKEFYEEYFAMADLPAEFYLETVRRVFQEQDLARGVLNLHGRKVEPRAIRRTALFTVEGEKDDICSIGQTLAAQELCETIQPYMREHHVQTGAGHYGVFNGRRWNSHIYPRLREFIHAFDSHA